MPVFPTIHWSHLLTQLVSGNDTRYQLISCVCVCVCVQELMISLRLSSVARVTYNFQLMLSTLTSKPLNFSQY